TRADGSFTIPPPVPTGEQTLRVDGSTIPVEVRGEGRVYTATSVALNIGLNQSNVIQRPIYLAPLELEGATEFTEETSGIVSVSNPSAAPGVELRIPADKVTFPDGSRAGKINIGT